MNRQNAHIKRLLTLIQVSVVILLIAPKISGTTAPVWPKVINTPKGDITVYQPQPETLNGTDLSGRAAVSVKSPDSKRQIFGAIWITSSLVIDRDTRIAILKDIKIPNVRFSDEIDSATSLKITKLIEEEMPKWNLEFSMDDMISTLESASVHSDKKFKNDPPEIIIANKPSCLVLLDGDPILKELKGYEFQKIENSPYFIIFEAKTKSYYLYGDKIWLSTNELFGTWELVKKPSSSLKKLQDDIEKSNNQQSQEPSAASSNLISAESVPAIIVRTKPAELIVIDGEPEFNPIQNTNLLYIKNTDNNVFMDIQSQLYFILISGRWYTAAKMSGPWSFLEADKLPEEFAKIPEGSENDIVLASVPGTNASKEAILDSQIPQTAEINRKTATVTVEYDGEPKFEKVDGTTMLYAVNSPQTVLKVSNKYYCVDNGIWFESNAPKGPWQVAVARPEEVEKIEPSSTVYNVKYVYIYDSTPDIVYVGYTPGYYGCYVYGPTVIYGTGYYYYPWYHTYYYPRPVTYGFSMHYNPYTGWGMSVGFAYGPVHISFGSPYHGCYYGPPAYRPPYHYHPPHGGYYPPHGGYPPSAGRPPSGGGNQPGYGRPDRPPASGSGNRVSNNMYANNRPGVNPNIATPSTGNTGGNRGTSSRPRPNNVYTDKSGNVYQKNNKGGWDQRQGNDWKPADRSTGSASDRSNKAGSSNRPSTGNTSSPARPSTGNTSPSARPSTQPSYNRIEMERESASRDRGASRTSNYNNYSGGSRSSSPARSSGGAGGRRR